MDAANYNANEAIAGRITSAHFLGFTDMNEFSEKVKAWQRGRGLRDDGKFGPLSRAEWDRHPKSEFAWEGDIYLPIVGGCYWSANAFNPGHHDGRDGFDAPKGPKGWRNCAGAEVCAIADGEVTKIAKLTNGFWVKVDHGSGLVSLSGHLADEGWAEKGDTVSAGDLLGTLWGEVHPPHIHFQAWVGGELVDPADLLEGLGAKVWKD